MAQAMKVFAPMVQGFAADRAARYEAKQLEAEGKAVEAQGTRQAEQLRRQTKGILGDMTAAMVGQGGTASDPSSIRQQARVESRGKFNELAAIFNAGERAAGIRNKAKATRFQGKMAKSRGIMEGVSNIGGSDMMAMFGG